MPRTRGAKNKNPPPTTKSNKLYDLDERNCICDYTGVGKVPWNQSELDFIGDLKVEHSKIKNQQQLGLTIFKQTQKYKDFKNKSYSSESILMVEHSKIKNQQQLAMTIFKQCQKHKSYSSESILSTIKQIKSKEGLRENRRGFSNRFTEENEEVPSESKEDIEVTDSNDESGYEDETHKKKRRKTVIHESSQHKKQILKDEEIQYLKERLDSQKELLEQLYKVNKGNGSNSSGFHEIDRNILNKSSEYTTTKNYDCKPSFKTRLVTTKSYDISYSVIDDVRLNDTVTVLFPLYYYSSRFHPGIKPILKPLLKIENTSLQDKVLVLEVLVLKVNIKSAKFSYTEHLDFYNDESYVPIQIQVQLPNYNYNFLKINKSFDTGPKNKDNDASFIIIDIKVIGENGDNRSINGEQ